MGTSPASTDRGQRPPAPGLSRAQRIYATVVMALVAVAALARSMVLRHGRHGLFLILLAVGATLVGLVAVRIQRRGLRDDAPGAPTPGTLAAILDGLGHGWQTIHDVALGSERIDHVAVGPPGAFVATVEPQIGRIELDRLDPAAVARARAQGETLERISGLPVRPLLVFTDGNLVDAPAAQVDGVTVVPAPVLSTYLRRLPQAFDEGEVAEVGEALRLALEVDAADVRSAATLPP